MRRITSVLIFALAGLALALAQKPAQVLDKAVAVIDGAGGVTANYTLTSSHGNSNGTFAMSGEKFRVLSPEVKCWFDGNDQWAYSPTTGEVNITTPTARELQMTNPLAAARAFKKGCKLSKAKRQAPGMHTIVLIPNERGDVKGITLDIDRNLSAAHGSVRDEQRPAFCHHAHQLQNRRGAPRVHVHLRPLASARWHRGR